MRREEEEGGRRREEMTGVWIFGESRKAREGRERDDLRL
jgi:hypothetical protein